jgi:hypothetical protein
LVIAIAILVTAITAQTQTKKKLESVALQRFQVFFGLGLSARLLFLGL